MWPPSGKCRISRSSKPGSCCFICTNPYSAPPSSKITACCPLVKYVHHLARQSDTENSFVWASVSYRIVKSKITFAESSCLEYGMKKEVWLPWSTNAESAQDRKVEWVNASAHKLFFFFNIIFVCWLEMQSAPKIACLAGQGELRKTNVLLQYTLYFPLSKHTSNFTWKWWIKNKNKK